MRGWLGAVGIAIAGCVTPAPSASAPLVETGTLVVVSTDDQALPGSDAVPRMRVAFRSDDGSLSPVDREAIAFVPRWRQGAALIDPVGRLYEVTPDGARRMLAREAIGPMAVSDDGERLAFVTTHGFLGALHVHDGARDIVWVDGLAGAGALRFDGDGVLFVGGPPGSIAGLHRATPDALACLSNCALRTGTDWRAAFVPPPVNADAIDPRVDRIHWTDADGVPHEVAR